MSRPTVHSRLVIYAEAHSNARARSRTTANNRNHRAMLANYSASGVNPGSDGIFTRHNRRRATETVKRVSAEGPANSC